MSEIREGFRGAVDTMGARFVCAHCYRRLPTGRDDQQETFIADVLAENGGMQVLNDAADDDCPVSCRCICHMDVELIGPEHLPDCRWADPNFPEDPLGLAARLWDGVYDSDGDEILRDVGAATGGCVFCGMSPEDVKPGPLPTWPAREMQS